MPAREDEGGFEAFSATVQAAADVEAAIYLIRDHYGVDNATYHLTRTMGGDADSPFVKSTYPAAWLTRYLVRGYVRIDPVVRAALSRQLPFDWREIEVDADAHELMVDAVQNGLGQNGYTVPIRDKALRKALFSLNSSKSADAWTDFVEAHAGELNELAHALHRKAIRELYGDKDPVPSLGLRELECLTWSAQGKDYKDIAILLDISEHTARSYLKSARYKLDCVNIAQAVAKAIRFGLITP